MNLRWSHTALNCRDQRATEDFYRRWFGFQRARVVELGAEQIIFLRQGDTYLELFQVTSVARKEPAAGDGPHNTGTVRHVAFQTDDLDAFLARIGDAIPISLGPLRFDDFIPGWRSVWLFDPDGVIVEVSEGYRDENPPSSPEGTYSEIVWLGAGRTAPTRANANRTTGFPNSYARRAQIRFHEQSYELIADVLLPMVDGYHRKG